jgi:two-component sensor histidine kinase
VAAGECPVCADPVAGAVAFGRDLDGADPRFGAGAQARTEEAMLGATLRSATGEVAIIRFAQGAVAALASTPSVIASSQDCPLAMRVMARQVPAATLVAFVPRDGQMTCSSNGRSFDYSGVQQFEEIVAAQKPTFVVSRNAPVSATSVLLITHPVYAVSGDYLGYTSIALPHTGLQGANSGTRDQKRADLVAPTLFWTFDGDGNVLTASNGLDAVSALLPTGQTLADVVGSNGEVYNDVTATGVLRTYAVVPIVPGELMLMSSWAYGADTGMKGWGLSPYWTPIFMWALGMIAAAWAAEWLVTRHVRRLTFALGRFANGDRSLQIIDLSEAPVEVREAGEAFSSMADGVMHAEASMEDSIHQKEVLLREVHHRVKNNLQLIASIMNLQMRKAVAPESKALLKGLHDRVMGLATIHRGLYQTSGMADVRADELLIDIVRQIVSIGSGVGRKIELSFDVEEVHLTPDQAVPLSLFLTEAMNNAMKYAGASPDGLVRVTVRLRLEGGRGALMEVDNSLATTPPETDTPPEGTGLGDQLLRAFAHQLGGTVETDVSQTQYRLRLRFDVVNLTAAENRAVPVQA